MGVGPNGITYINEPAGNINDPKSKIFPFKLHIAKQPYDVVNKYLLQPITSGKDGFWTNFDWNNAFTIATPITGLKYSGQYGFGKPICTGPQRTWCNPPIRRFNAMPVTVKTDNSTGVALGYPGDPVEWGGRDK